MIILDIIGWLFLLAVNLTIRVATACAFAAIAYVLMDALGADQMIIGSIALLGAVGGLFLPEIIENQ